MDVWTDIMPERPGDYGSTPRALHSRFIDEWENAPHGRETRGAAPTSRDRERLA